MSETTSSARAYIDLLVAHCTGRPTIRDHFYLSIIVWIYNDERRYNIIHAFEIVIVRGV